jgi:hypothetical protein
MKDNYYANEPALDDGDFDPDLNDEFDEDDGLDECGQVPDGGCAMAGTEYCDFECPFRDEDLFDDEDGDEDGE